MKKLALVSALVMGSLFCKTADAQIGINLGFRFGSHHIAPVAQVAVNAPIYADNDPANYDDDYYYLPDVGAYYNVAEQCYYYNDGNNWISAAYLPGYRDYDWRNARHYEVRARRPYLNDGVYSQRFGGRADNWNRGGDRYPQAYANRDFNRGDYRQADPRFDNRGHWGGEERQGERFDRRENFAQPQENRDQRFEQQRNDNTGTLERNQPQPQNRGNENFGQPSNGQHDSAFCCPYCQSSDH